MPSFPDHVQSFETGLREGLEQLKCELRVDEDRRSARQPAVVYKVSGMQWPTTVMVHQTLRSLEADEPEYRVRAWTSLPDEVAKALHGLEGPANRYATLAALTKSEKGFDVGCQALLTPESTYLIAAFVATACVYGGTSIVEALRRTMLHEKAEVTALSAWSDIDFEQIHYDHAHLGVGRLGKHAWRMLMKVGKVGGVLELSGTHGHPFFQGGLLSLLEVPNSLLDLDKNPIGINDLNTAAFLLDDAPFFGAWCDLGDRLVFATFVPNFLKQVEGIPRHLVRWSRRRAETIAGLIDLCKESTSEKKATEAKH